MRGPFIVVCWADAQVVSARFALTERGANVMKGVWERCSRPHGRAEVLSLPHLLMLHRGAEAPRRTTFGAGTHFLTSEATAQFSLALAATKRNPQEPAATDVENLRRFWDTHALPKVYGQTRSPFGEVHP